ncbi:MAG TPA: tetratricopeptide repeat protein [Chryseosolibacter sp.]
MITKSLTYIVLFTALAGASLAQTPDSLLNTLESSQGDKKVKTLNELFRFYIASDPVKALGYTRQALTLATEINDERGMAAAYNNLGVAYRNQGALDKALEYYITSLKLYTKLDNKEGIATTKNNIANIYSIKKDYGQAMKYLEESYTLFVQLGDKFKVIGSMNNLGNLYSDIQLYEKAQKYYSEAYQLSESNGLKYSDPLSNLGNIHFRQNDFAKAIDFYMKALAIETENNNRLGMLNLMTNLGIAYVKSKQPALASKYLTEAEKLSTELQAYTSLPTIHKASADNYAAQGKFKEAYQMQVKYDEAREKIYGEESSRNIAQMEMVMDFQEKEKELEILKREDEIKTLELRNSRLFIILVILGVLVVLALVNLFYLDRKKKLVTP